MRGYSGATPLTVAMRKRATMYVNFLLQNGADPNLADTQRRHPADDRRAARLPRRRTSMLGGKAAVDATNRQGETALIIAVQNRHVPAVKRLLEAGASPARTDNASGLSARDYAARDRRSAEILKLIDSVKKKPRVRRRSGHPVIIVRRRASGRSAPTGGARRGGRSATVRPCAAPALSGRCAASRQMAAS